MNNENFFAKKRSARIIVCICLCLPLILAVFFATRIDPSSVAAGAIKSISVTFDGQSNTFNDEDSFAVYSEIQTASREIDSSFRDFTAENPYIVEFTESDDSKITYKLYMINDENDCIYSTEDGKYFMMDPSVAQKLLVRNEFSDVNQDSFLPVATIERSGEKIRLSPSVFNWTYTALDGKPVVTDGNRDAVNPVVKFNNTNVGVLSFDRAPDSVKVTVKSAGETIFDDAFENLATALAYPSDTKLDMTIVAEWYEIDGAEFFGKLTYTLSALYDVAPTYTVVDDHALPKGDFTVVRMSDFNDGEKLTVQSDIGLPESINVFDKLNEPGIKFAFLPLPITAANGSHSITLVTSDGNSQTVTVGIKDMVNPPASQSTVISDETLQAAFTSNAWDEFGTAVAAATANSANAQLWVDKFTYPTGSSAVVTGGASYGTSRDIKSLYSKTYIHEGVDLASTENAPIKAANTGKVVFAGSLTLTGNTVIVDHGSGVFSYYGNLGTISTSVGDSVTNQTVIGTAGFTGFACNSSGTKVPMVHFAVSVSGVFIDPNSPCKYGINI